LHNHFLIRNDGHLIIFDFNECSEFTVAITDEYFVLLDFQNRMNSANRNVGYFDITIMSSSLGLKIGITNMSRFLVNLMNTNKLSSVSNNIKSEASYYSPITSIIHPFYFENMRNVLLHISQINTFLWYIVINSFSNNTLYRIFIHYYKQLKCVYFIDPMQLQIDINGFLAEFSYSKQILHTI